MATYDDDVSSGSQPFDLDYDPRLPSGRFESFRSTPDRFPETADDPLEPDSTDSPFTGTNGFGHHHSEHSYTAFDDEAGQQPSYTDSFRAESLTDFNEGPDFSTDEHPNGKIFQAYEGGNGLYTFAEEDTKPANNGAVLPPPEQMQAEEGFVLREWKRQNALRLEEKERKEKEALASIERDAADFKDEYYAKRKANNEAVAKSNREREKVFLANQENFHADAHKNYWKAVAELIPTEVPTLEGKSRGKDKDKKKPSVMINQGPKPGKSTDLTRMRMILMKLKHSPPNHMKPPPPPAPAPAPAANGAPANPQSTPTNSQAAPSAVPA